MLNSEEIKKASVQYFGGDELAASTWVNKYALRDKNGNVLEKTPDEMHHRMAYEFARKEKEYFFPKKRFSDFSKTLNM